MRSAQCGASHRQAWLSSTRHPAGRSTRVPSVLPPSASTITSHVVITDGCVASGSSPCPSSKVAVILQASPPAARGRTEPVIDSAGVLLVELLRHPLVVARQLLGIDVREPEDAH